MKITNNNPILGRRFRHNPDFKNPKMGFFALESQARIKEKVNRGIYKYQASTCFCGSKNSVLLAEMDRQGNYYPFVICKRCGITRANPRLTEDSYTDFYSYEYRALYGDNDIDKNKLWQHRTIQAQEIYNFITSHVKLPKKAVVLDIGCNMGTTLIPFYEDGHEVRGLDYETDYIEYGRKRTGFGLEIGGVEKLKVFDKKTDLIILNHVVEHFLDLEKELKIIRDSMNPGSFIFVSLPGTFWWIKAVCASNIMGLLQNAHVWQFSLDSLKYVMECSGFQPVYVNEEIKSIFKKTDSFRDRKNVPEQEFKKAINYLKNAERRYLARFCLKQLLKPFNIKRLIGML